jgi:hypothetical protein
MGQRPHWHEAVCPKLARGCDCHKYRADVLSDAQRAGVEDVDPRQGRPEGKGHGVPGTVLLGPPAVHLRLLGGSIERSVCSCLGLLVSGVMQTYRSLASRSWPAGAHVTSDHLANLVTLTALLVCACSSSGISVSVGSARPHDHPPSIADCHSSSITCGCTPVHCHLMSHQRV